MITFHTGNSMKIRPHRGALAEAMASCRNIEPTLNAVVEFLRGESGGTFVITPDLVSVKKYGSGLDERTGWDTYAVSLRGMGIMAWIDGPLEGMEIAK
ncbi:hypothetical protein [Xanthomonas campestris]|uniref:hypothetical protein n=1 Tax=Xanthomonas campestris TaxID=339 RepID=UPI002B226A30|nr:hypothetical protein [Xanthomonas campestris]MEA9762083.1 hypothetical protein [Xanthomonas campestris pv. raphani]MEA9814687.1 hypothetical protein [Xanthomonas campestris pv. raphani]MEA9907820.1 hypothetical protein [Xanthomonas campestris pv. raphani]MEA9924245.1 hypothetical protein [Xanthomonas campestris pv. raphani]MEA9936081.1 hypothetical protein [Xanthomonas campestris pv. raphani]